MQWSSPGNDVCRPQGLSEVVSPPSVDISAGATFLLECRETGCSFELPHAMAVSAVSAETMARDEVN